MKRQINMTCMIFEKIGFNFYLIIEHNLKLITKEYLLKLPNNTVTNLICNKSLMT